MNFRKFVAVFVLLMSGSLVRAECSRPDKVAIPDGSQANESEMVAADKAAKQYMSDMQGYLDCLETDARANRQSNTGASKSEKSNRENVAVKKHNAAAEEMTAVAEEFRQAVADYEARQ